MFWEFRGPRLRLAYLCVAGLMMSFTASGAEPPRLPSVDVISTTPLPGIGLPREQVPAPVQSATDADIRRSNALDLTDF